jgi:hypothetical protein
VISSTTLNLYTKPQPRLAVCRSIQRLLVTARFKSIGFEDKKKQSVGRRALHKSVGRS